MDRMNVDLREVNSRIINAQDRVKWKNVVKIHECERKLEGEREGTKE